MKRFTILIFLFLCAGHLVAQKPSLNKAYNLYYEKDFVKAKEMIDLCTQDPKLQTRAQTWLYKGNIDFYLANQEYGEKQQNSDYRLQFPNTPSESFDAFQKALEINRNVESYEMLTPEEGLSKLYALLLIEGVDQLIAESYGTAKKTLEKAIYSYEMKTPEHPLQGEIYYYYAYALEMLNQPGEAGTYYEKAIQDGSVNPSVYIRLIEQYKNEGNSAKVIEFINKAKTAIPGNPTVMVAEVDYYWDTDPAKGEQLLSQLPASVYTNPDALVNMANLYIKKEDYIKAEDLLKKANRINPGNFVIVYNLGYCYLKLYDQKFMEANNLAIAGNKEEAAQATRQSEVYLDNAEAFFEQALTFGTDELNIMEQLKEIYARKKSPKYEEMIEKINNRKR